MFVIHKCMFELCQSFITKYFDIKLLSLACTCCQKDFNVIFFLFHMGKEILLIRETMLLQENKVDNIYLT